MARNDSYSLRQKHQHTSADADQAEFSALRLGATVVSAGIYDDRVAGALDDYAVSNSEQTSWAQEDMTADTAVGEIQEEIERRQSLLGSVYPFSLSDGTLAYKPLANLTYEFLLAISVSNSLTTGTSAQLPRIFERLTSQLIAQWLGTSSVVHTGSPRDEKVGTSFADAMAHVCGEFTEPRWHPQEHLPEAPGQGDHGVDFIVCKRTPDKRSIGQLFLLGQCACGNDWTSKFGDLTIERLGKWFHPFSLVPAIRAFAVPHQVGDGWLREASTRAGLVFDRSRLTMIGAEPAAAKVVDDWKAEMTRLVAEVVSQPEVARRSRASKKRVK